MPAYGSPSGACCFKNASISPGSMPSNGSSSPANDCPSSARCIAARLALSSSASSSLVFRFARYIRTRFTTKTTTANANTAQYSFCVSLMGSAVRSPDNTARSHGNIIPASGFAASRSGSGETPGFVSAVPPPPPSSTEPPPSVAASSDADASAFAPDSARDALAAGPSPPGPFALAHARAPAANPR